MTSASNDDRAMEGRLAALETKLGLRNSSSSSSNSNHRSSNTNTNNANVVDNTNNNTNNNVDVDVESRLLALQRTMEERTTPEFRSVWKESLQLLQDLDPGAGLTHQQQPLLYKRQEVLASADTLQRDFAELSQIWHLLTSSSSSSSSSSGAAAGGGASASHNISTTLSQQDAVTQAPIITDIRISADDQRRLDAVRVTLEDLNGRTRMMALRLNQLLEAYHTVMSAASEKCILVDEVLASREEAAAATAK